MNPQTLGILQPFSKNFSVYYGLVIVLGPRKSKWKEYTMMALHVGPGVRLAGFEAFCNNYLGDLGSFFFFSSLIYKMGYKICRVVRRIKS